MSNCPECGGPAKTDPDFPYYPLYDDSELRALRERIVVLNAENIAYYDRVRNALAALKEKP